MTLKPTEPCPHCGRREIYDLKVWDKPPWVDWGVPESVANMRRLSWKFREWLYTPAEQAEIRKRFPDLDPPERESQTED